MLPAMAMNQDSILSWAEKIRAIMVTKKMAIPILSTKGDSFSFAFCSLLVILMGRMGFSGQDLGPMSRAQRITTTITGHRPARKYMGLKAPSKP